MNGGVLRYTISRWGGGANGSTRDLHSRNASSTLVRSTPTPHRENVNERPLFNSKCTRIYPTGASSTIVQSPILPVVYDDASGSPPRSKVTTQTATRPCKLLIINMKLADYESAALPTELGGLSLFVAIYRGCRREVGFNWISPPKSTPRFDFSR